MGMGSWTNRPVRDLYSGAEISRQARGMKVRSSVKKLCDGCKVRRACSLGLRFERERGLCVWWVYGWGRKCQEAKGTRFLMG